MKILVTGASGFVGLHVCTRLLADRHELTALRQPGSPDPPSTAPQIPEISADVRDAEAILHAIRGFDAVIHAAGSIAFWPPNKIEQKAINIDGTRNVASACRINRIGRLIHVSSVAALGIPMKGDAPADESFEYNLDGKGLTYPDSKRQGEMMVREQVALGLDAVIVNPAFIMGPDPRGYRGWQLLEKCIGKRVAGYFPGGISPVHVEDVANGIVAALAMAPSGDQLILAGENITFREITRRVAARTGSRPLLIPTHAPITAIGAMISERIAARKGILPRITRDGHITGQLMNFYSSDHARTTIGYNPRSFNSILDEALAWGEAVRRERARQRKSDTSRQA
jgi:dihydroflavonol-4-reductase